MKVMQVLFSGLGGHGSVVTSLINADENNEWEHCILFYGIEDLLPSYKNFCSERNIPFSFIKKSRGVLKTGWRAIQKEFKYHNPDCIILHSPTLIFPAWLFCHNNKKKLFVVEHTPHSIKRIAEKIASFFSIMLANKVVCLSHEYRQRMHKQFSVLPVLKNTIIIQNGIDLHKFYPVEKPATDELNVGMIGRFSEQKNQAMIIEAAILGFKSGQFSKNIHFHFAGNGETLSVLERLTKEKNLESQVHFYGLLNEEEIKEFLAKLDIYIHASFAETMCTSVMQAMACGLPVIASNIPGINNIVEDQKNALLFANNDMSGLVDSLTEMRNACTRKQIGESAREYAELNFSSTAMFNKYNYLVNNY